MKDSTAIILVVDVNDPERFDEVKEQLIWLCSREEFKGIPLLVMANKSDLPNALPVSTVTEMLGLTDEAVLGVRPWFIHPTCMMSGEGLDAGLNWLETALTKREISTIRSKVSLNPLCE
jgi:ADP-ribosylation factor protein 1